MNEGKYCAPHINESKPLHIHTQTTTRCSSFTSCWGQYGSSNIEMLHVTFCL